MSMIAGTLEVNGNPYNRAEIVKKTDQNELKGIVWQSVGTTFAFAAVGATVGTAAFVGGSALALAGLTAADSMFSTSVPVIGALMGSAIIADIALVKGVATCFTNAMYHLGPDTEIHYQSPNTHMQEHSFSKIPSAA